MTDFEKGILNAREDVCPAVPVSGCFQTFLLLLLEAINVLNNLGNCRYIQYNDAEEETIRVYTMM